MIGVLVKHHRRNTLGVKPVCRSESPHSASQNDNVWHSRVLFRVFCLYPLALGSNGREFGNVHNRCHGEANLPWTREFFWDELGAYLACMWRSVRCLAQAVEPNLAPVNQFVL